MSRRHAALLISTLCVACSQPVASTDQAAVAGAPLLSGTPVPRCGWPSVVQMGNGCSGVLVHPQVVVQAAHCSSSPSVIVVRSPEQPTFVEVEACYRHPEAGLDTGTDVGFCFLRERVEGVATVPPALGCELDSIEPGVEVTAIGFGLEAEGGTFGVKRELTGTVLEVGQELVIGGEGFGTCEGDSGGPAMVRLASGEWRIAGILSSTDKGVGCEEHRAYYSMLDRVASWIEETAQVDLTPCFGSDGSWNPTADCLAIEDERSCSQERMPSESCGLPFQASADEEAPEIELLVDRDAERAVAEARDDGWGIREVTFELYAGDVRTLLRADGIAPYELVYAGQIVPPQRVVATARDFADHTASKAVVLVDESAEAGEANTGPVREIPPAHGGGCRALNEPPARTSVAWFGAILAALSWRRRARRPPRQPAKISSATRSPDSAAPSM